MRRPHCSVTVSRVVKLVAATGALVAPAALLGQTNRTVLFAPSYQSWQFGKPVPLDSVKVESATQISLPFLFEHTLGMRWRASASGAAFSSNVSTTAASRSLAGLSDLRLRATGRVIGDVVQLTLGVNVPTGATGLSIDENELLRVTAAPALGANVTVPGLGFGGTVGAIVAHSAGPWALAVGAAYEQRGKYSPVDAAIAGGGTRTNLVPGSTVHVSLGADRLIGASRLTVGLVGDLYGSDEIEAVQNGRTQSDSYQLGPTGFASVTLQVGSSRIRDFVIQVSNRYRSAFKDARGATVSGSSGNYAEGSMIGTIGSPGRPSLVLGIDGRVHSGLPVDKSLIGAALTAGGATIGLSLPSGAVEWRPSVRVSQGTLTTERVATTVLSLTAGLSISAR